MANRSVLGTAGSRWGMLVVTALLGVGMPLFAAIGWRSAVAASETITRGQSAAFVHAVGERNRTDGPLDGEALAEILAEHQGEGLRYLALIGHEQVLAEAGARIGPSVPPRPGELRIDSGRVRVAQELGPPGFPFRRHGGGMLPPRPPDGMPPRVRVLLEFEPLLARELTAGATRNLVLSVLGAVVLTAAALVFWRVSVRGAAAEAGLARQRHLATLGEMSAVLGHEIRNPLASLKGHAQLLAEADLDERARARAERVVAEAVRLEELSATLLDFVRAERIERLPVSPRELLDLAAEAVDAARIQVRAERAPPSWPLDRNRMHQVLVNLLRNALDASPGGAEAEVSRRSTELVFTVRDHGPGFPDGEAERIFDAFHTTKLRGTGLGLAVARRIVEGHQGSIRASNHPDGGAVFEVRIPRPPSSRGA